MRQLPLLQDVAIRCNRRSRRSRRPDHDEGLLLVPGNLRLAGPDAAVCGLASARLVLDSSLEVLDSLRQVRRVLIRVFDVIQALLDVGLLLELARLESCRWAHWRNCPMCMLSHCFISLTCVMYIVPKWLAPHLDEHREVHRRHGAPRARNAPTWFTCWCWCRGMVSRFCFTCMVRIGGFCLLGIVGLSISPCILHFWAGM